MAPGAACAQALRHDAPARRARRAATYDMYHSLRHACGMILFLFDLYVVAGCCPATGLEAYGSLRHDARAWRVRRVALRSALRRVALRSALRRVALRSALRYVIIAYGMTPGRGGCGVAACCGVVRAVAAVLMPSAALSVPSAALSVPCRGAVPFLMVPAPYARSVTCNAKNVHCLLPFLHVIITLTAVNTKRHAAVIDEDIHPFGVQHERPYVHHPADMLGGGACVFRGDAEQHELPRDRRRRDE